ncbi:hypothetical protein F4821DRAFT_275098 [Hypoxylon rubiginosum]|uniref:Uncharacterized protein n=1 Tax=Hypoxylon rubiginosum TaxID=110542 RepID=A0ACC0DD90_9PEZI|nr:hypothetical protein F4821DRAFT_275098 [Hypoxylon rubiginosum]
MHNWEKATREAGVNTILGAPIVTYIPSSAMGHDNLVVETTVNRNLSIITYAYTESPSARENLLFFLDKGFHDGADFIFILYGRTDAKKFIPPLNNFKVALRPNKYADICEHSKVLPGAENSAASLFTLADRSIENDVEAAIIRKHAQRVFSDITDGNKIELGDVSGVKSGQSYLVDLEVAVPSTWAVRDINDAEEKIRTRIGSKVRGVRIRGNLRKKVEIP